MTLSFFCNAYYMFFLSLTSWSRGCQEAVHDVGTEVYTEPHTDDDDVHGGDLDGDAPPVHEARHVHTGQQHTEHHKQGSSPAACTVKW